MHYYYPSETYPSFDLHPRSRSPISGPQVSYFPRSQDPNLTYYNPIPYKLNTTYQEDPFPSAYNAEFQQIGGYSTRDCATFGNAMSPSYSRNFFNKPQYGGNFNFGLESHITSLGAAPEFNSHDLPFKEKAGLEPFQPSFIDDFVCAGEEFFPEGQFETKQVLFLQDPMTNSSTDEPSSAPTDPLEQMEEVVPVSTCKVGGPSMKGWCEDDEKTLKKLAVQYRFDWKKISKKFANKKYTPHFLKMRYKGYDEGPVPKRIKFTHEEDVMIAKYFIDYGIDWEKMVTHFPNRTSVMLKNRYYSYIRKNNRLDELLKEAGKLEADQIQQYTLQFMKNAENESTVSTIDDKASQSDDSKGSPREEHLDAVKNNDELVALRAQVKSLKGLYAVTYKELSKLRSERIGC